LQWKFDTQGFINVVSNGCVDGFNIPSILELIKTNKVIFQGCHIIAPNDKWKILSGLIQDSLHTLLNIGLVDDDQTLLLMAYLTNPSIFKVIEGDSNDWFKIFTMNGGEDAKNFY
jgi:hypothetical protein